MKTLDIYPLMIKKSRDFKYYFTLSLLLSILILPSCWKLEGNTDKTINLNLKDFSISNDSLACCIWLKNNSKKKRQIKSILYSCGCMSGKVSGSEIPIEDSVNIKFVINNPKHDTLLQKSIYVVYTDNSKQDINITLHPKYIFAVLPKSKSLFFNNCIKGNRYNDSITIINTGNSKLKITDYSISNKFFNMQILSDSTIVPNSKIILPVNFRATSKGLYNGHILLHTNDVSTPKLQFWLYATIEN